MIKSTVGSEGLAELGEPRRGVRREVGRHGSMDIDALDGVVAELAVAELAELDGAKPLVHPAADRLHGFVQVIRAAADRRVYRHPLVHESAQEGVDGHPQGLALEVPERDVDARDDRHGGPGAAPPLARFVHPVPQGGRLEGVLADQMREVVVHQRRHGFGGEVADDHLAQAGDPGVRLDPDEGAALVPAARFGPLLVHRRPVSREQVGRDAGDLHGFPWLTQNAWTEGRVLRRAACRTGQRAMPGRWTTGT